MRVDRGRRTSVRGQETLQTILVVAFVLLPVLIAIFTFGSIIHTYIGAQAAAARGARNAGAVGGFGPAEFATVTDELVANGIDPNQCSISATAAEVSLGQPIGVTVNCPQHVGIPFLVDDNVNLSSTFVGRGEVNQ